MKVAVVHDWLASYSGAERVLEQILLCYPGADVFSLVDFLPEKDRGFLGGSKVITSNLQNMPFARKRFRNYLAWMPYWIESLDVTGYDLVISSSWAFAKGVIVRPDQPHVSYMHTPMRYTSSLKYQYLEQAGLTRGLKGLYARRALHQLKVWDATSTSGVDLLVGNSRYIGARIMKSYRREAEVIYPPVAIDDFPLQTEKEEFYLCVSRLVHYKRMDVVVQAFNKMPDKKLVVIGDGDEFEKIKATAGPNVEMMGYQTFPTLKEKMGAAKAFIMAAEEDFGIVVAEAQASGTPALVFARGGSPEILRLDGPEPTGLTFAEQTPEAVIDVVNRFEALPNGIDPAACRANAERFAPEVFRQALMDAVDRTIQGFADPGTPQRDLVRSVG